MAEVMAEERTGLVEVTAVHTASAALPDDNKNKILWSQKRRGSLTDANRVRLVEGVLETDAEWVMWFDDDTVPPQGVISRLLALRRPFCAGLYFLTGKPHNPIAYFRNQDGMYQPLWNYPPGALLQVDSVGMGCTLVHRTVYETIRAQHKIFQRPDGSIFPLHQSKIRGGRPRNHKYDETFVDNGVLYMPVKMINLEDPDDLRSFPYYAMEYGRTEDHFFCELAAAVGYKPWVDTSIVCEHLKPQATTVETYQAELAKERQ